MKISWIGFIFLSLYICDFHNLLMILSKYLSHTCDSQDSECAKNHLAHITNDLINGRKY